MRGLQTHKVILFVCRGNLCRSPIALALLRWRLRQMRPGCERVQVDSAGYCDWGTFAREAHPFARRAAMQVCGEDLLAEHRAKHWTPDMVESAGLIIVAEEWMRADFPRESVLTMRELGGESGDVEDPYGKDYGAYVACASEIDGLIASGIPYLVK